MSFGTIKISKSVYNELNKLRVHRPDIDENVYEKTFSVVIMDLIKNRDIVVNEWNERNPIGTEVAVALDDGSIKQTKTRSEAWLASGTPVVMVEGIQGGYLLSRVTAKNQDEYKEG